MSNGLTGDRPLDARDVLPRAAEVMRELEWHHLLAKRGYPGETRRYQQSLLDHSLVGLDVLLALGGLLGRPDAMSLTAQELMQACLGTLAHDAGKAGPAWQQWIRRGDETPSPGHGDEQRILDTVARFGARLDFPVEREAITAALRTLRSERGAAATAHQIFSEHRNRRWIVIADLVAAVDHACSAPGLLAAVRTLRDGYLGDKLEFNYHLVRARGFSTPFVHRAAEEAFQSAGWTISVRFPEGSLYAGPRKCGAPAMQGLVDGLTHALETALGDTSGAGHAELVVSRRAATQTVFPSPDIVDIARLREYLEVARTRARPEGFARKKAAHQRAVLDKYFAHLDVDLLHEYVGVARNRPFRARFAALASERRHQILYRFCRRALRDDAILGREAGRVARARPEMMILKVLRDATLVKDKEGKVFNPTRACFDEAAERSLDAFADRLAKAYDELIGHQGAYEELARTSTLQPFQDMRTVHRFWRLPASRFGGTIVGDRVELLPDDERATLLIDRLVAIFEQAVADLPAEHRPRSLTPRDFAEAFARDVVHPGTGAGAPDDARRELQHYCAGKESTKTPSGDHLCPICNEAFGAGRPAKADFLDKPEQHTNRAPALGSGAPIIICAACRLDRVFGKLIAGFRPELTFVIYPRHNVGREAGRGLVERARAFIRRASVFMTESTPDPGRKPSLSLTEMIARNLDLRSPEGLSGEELADVLLFRNNAEKLEEYRSKLVSLVREHGGETIEEQNAAFDTSYPDLASLLGAIERGEVDHEVARGIRADAFALRTAFAMVVQTPHAILVPSADSLRLKVEGKEEAELNAGIRQVFVALVLALGLDARVAILRDGVPPEPDLLEGLLRSRRSRPSVFCSGARRSTFSIRASAGPGALGLRPGCAPSLPRASSPAFASPERLCSLRVPPSTRSWGP